MEAINSLIEEIVRTALDNVPDKSWIRGKVDIALLSTYAETTAEYFVKEDSEGIAYLPGYPDAPAEKDIDILFLQLRSAMYALAPAKGAWYNAQLTFGNDGKYGITYDYDSKPKFEMTAEDEEYLIDTEQFPRDKSSMPTWLNNIINNGKY